MAVLITGAGLIGSYAARHVIDRYASPVVLFDTAFQMNNLSERLQPAETKLVRGDITNLAELVDVIQRHRIDRIIHTAAFLTWGVRERPAAGVTVNFGGTHNILEAARLTGVSRVVFCSSASVYFGAKDPPAGGTYQEDLPLRISTEYPPSLYAAMKLAAEWLGHRYRDEHGVDFGVVRLGAVFGPWHGDPSGGPTRLMKELVESAARNRPARIRTADLEGGGLDYVYASDAALGAVLAAFARTIPSRVYNISEGVSRRVPDVIAAIEAATGRPLSLDVIEDSANLSGYATDSPPQDLTRARAEIGYEPTFPMPRAVADYLGWYAR